MILRDNKSIHVLAKNDWPSSGLMTGIKGGVVYNCMSGF